MPTKPRHLTLRANPTRLAALWGTPITASRVSRPAKSRIRPTGTDRASTRTKNQYPQPLIYQGVESSFPTGLATTAIGDPLFWSLTWRVSDDVDWLILTVKRGELRETFRVPLAAPR